jgi:hypothetical protein
MTYLNCTPATHVPAAALLLDRACPNWERKIDLRTLEMMSCNDCILGQVYGRYERGLTEVADAHDLDLDDYRDRPSVFCAFHGGPDCVEAWHREVRMRLAVATHVVDELSREAQVLGIYK